MQKKLKIAVMALCYAPLAFAQSDSIGLKGAVMSETAFTFTEAQLGEDDDMSQNVSIINSNSNIYASEVGYLFSPMRFRYRAYDQRFNDIYINGAPIYDMESGQFRYSWVGGLNQQTRNMESSLPFESNNFSMSAMGGSNNYNFRPAAMPAGHRITLSGANRSYTLRGTAGAGARIAALGLVLFGNDVDHASGGITAPDGGTGSPEDFHPVDLVHVDPVQLVGIHGAGGIFSGNPAAVHQDQGFRGSHAP